MEWGGHQGVSRRLCAGMCVWIGVVVALVCPLQGFKGTAAAVDCCTCGICDGQTFACSGSSCCCKAYLDVVDAAVEGCGCAGVAASDQQCFLPALWRCWCVGGRGRVVAVGWRRSVGLLLLRIWLLLLLRVRLLLLLRVRPLLLRMRVWSLLRLVRG